MPIKPRHSLKTSRKTRKSTYIVICIAVLERIITFSWGLYQDSHMVPKFTDIDYLVFTDASRFMANGNSPYERETYRYTPLLAWLLLPSISWFFSFGKVLFAVGDIVAGILILKIFQIRKERESKALFYSSVWLLNPMVATISTRGSSEGLLGAMVISFVWAVCSKRYVLGGLLAGLSVHFKIYPIIYIPSVIWALDKGAPIINLPLLRFFNKDRVVFGLSCLASFIALTGLIYSVYGYPFLLHSYLHHLSRIDHRHNFSVYSTLLYYRSAWEKAGEAVSAFTESPPSSFLSLERIGLGIGHFFRVILQKPESWAFIPQLSLSGVVLPLAFSKHDLVKTMFLQTFAFVTFNKVCTSQYFMWYMVLLPFYLPSLLNGKKFTKSLVGLLWVAAQVLWIRQGYLLEFLGISTFYPGLFLSTLFFFVVNCWGLALFIECV
jgi:GPI mannosyltransferase 1 subunit M